MNEHAEPQTRGVVVVGVDGSPGAREALRWALAEARLRKVPLRIVHAWAFGYAGVPGGGFDYLGGAIGSSGLDLGDLHRAAEERVDRATTELAADCEGVEIERKVVEGAAAEVLVDAVGGSDLLVVGSRGHGGFAGLLLGSVSQRCAHYAPCPVVIVHAAERSDGTSGPAVAAGTEDEATA